MRPKELTSIFANISSIPGIGPKLQKLFTNIVGNKLVGFLWHVPYNIIKREHCENLLNAKINSLIILKVNVIKHKPSVFKRQPYRVNCICGDTPIDIIYFFAKHPYIKNILPHNFKVIIPENKYELNKFLVDKSLVAFDGVGKSLSRFRINFLIKKYNILLIYLSNIGYGNHYLGKGVLKKKGEISLKNHFFILNKIIIYCLIKVMIL